MAVNVVIVIYISEFRANFKSQRNNNGIYKKY